jgi:addiction module RelE/StbE family toxin
MRTIERTNVFKRDFKREKSHRECHLKPDLLLIYRKPNSEVLQLVRLGSHSGLFG